MAGAFQGVMAYALLPLLAVIVGGVVATFRVPGPRLRSAIQHFAAGVVFAAVAGELLPDIIHERDPLAVIVGFALGTTAMLAVRRLTERKGRAAADAARQPVGLLATLGVDLTIDGLLVGIGFAAGAKQGLLITIALTIEVLFLGLSAAAALSRASATRGRILATTAGLAALLAVSTAVGGTLLAGLSGHPLTGAVAFGAAALLYLVTEELLVEAHEVAETPASAAMFFVGFLALLLVEMMV